MCVRACVRACVCACVRASVRPCSRLSLSDIMSDVAMVSTEDVAKPNVPRSRPDSAVTLLNQRLVRTQTANLSVLLFAKH